ncbi:hypothetical protein RA265_28340, partial [Pseudomonas syringae pv. tagetis]|uniref:hypothetical protein n=1 Tax=Pseudomonas syringae group genomosp. 7 TaxID=251699 RepID=UPI0037706084
HPTQQALRDLYCRASFFYLRIWVRGRGAVVVGVVCLLVGVLSLVVFWVFGLGVCNVCRDLPVELLACGLDLHDFVVEASFTP